MSNDYSSLFVSNEVKDWFFLSEKYNKLEVGFKKELPAKYMLGYYQAQKDSRNIEKIKSQDKRDEKSLDIEMVMYKLARKCLENLVDRDMNRVLTDDILDNELSPAETIQHFHNIMEDKREALKEEIKK